MPQTRRPRARHALVPLALSLAIPGPVRAAAVRHLDPAGVDAAWRDGSTAEPWRSLHYAATRVGEGDELILADGDHVVDGPQVIGASNLTVRARMPGRASIDCSRLVDEWTHCVRLSGDAITWDGVDVKNNERGGRGLFVTGSRAVVRRGRFFGHGAEGIAVGESHWPFERAPRDVLVENNEVHSNVQWNNPQSAVYKGFREGGGGWPGALVANVAIDPVFRNNRSYENHGEGIIFTRVRGGRSEIRGNRARDNHSVNVYVDSVRGDADDYVDVIGNRAWSTYEQVFYRHGVPAQNIAVSSESYPADPFVAGNQKCRYVHVVGNTVEHGGRGIAVDNYGGLGIDSVAIRENVARENRTADGRPADFFLEDGPEVTNVWPVDNTGL